MPTSVTRRPPPVCVALASVAVVGLLAACGDGETGGAPTTSSTEVGMVVGTAAGTTVVTGTATTPSSATSVSPEPTPNATPTATCVDTTVARLTPEQRVGQLFMVGLSAGSRASSLDATLGREHVGAVVLLGTWSSAASVAAASARVQQVARADSGLDLLVAADQEGGQVQHLRGAGFSNTSSALTQGRDPAAAGATAARVGRELAAAGVNVDLAPVADVVAADFARRNGPIGFYQREYGHDPATASRAVTAVVGGLQGVGVSATLKHFPGLGRVTGNTDVTATGTTDATTAANDPWLQPFRDGVLAGADLVMVSSALYPKIDPLNRAVFSANVIGGVLRRDLGYVGVVVTDDVGAAAAVAAVPVGERATRFVAAGGDVILTGVPSTVPTMTAAVRARASAEPAFAARVDAAVHRVIALKVKRGLARCG